MQTVDPQGVWRNEYIERHLIGVGVADIAGSDHEWERAVGLGLAGLKTRKDIGWRVHKARQ